MNFAVISPALPGEQAAQVIAALRVVVMLNDPARFRRLVGGT